MAGGNGKGNQTRQLSSPRGVVVDRFGQIYVADFSNDRVIQWCEGVEEGIIVAGDNGEGQELNQLNSPADLWLDSKGNLYVTDRGNHRVQKFEID